MTPQPSDEQRTRSTAAGETGLRARPAPTEVDWPRWLRSIERRRRALPRPADAPPDGSRGVVPGRRPVWPAWLYREATRTSFCLDGIDVTDADVADALSVGRPLRSRPARRLRHHLAILRRLHRCRPRSADDVMRWYTSVSDGLSTANLGPARRDRLENVLRRINSPQMRLQPAVLETARLHAELLGDPMFPGFNGILARLLLHTHLANCGLPPVVFDPRRDHWRAPTVVTVACRLLELIDESLERLGAGTSE